MSGADADGLRAGAASGLMALTGRPDGPPVAPPPGLVTGLQGLVDALSSASGALGRPVRLSWPSVVTGRAALLGLGRRGTASANGTCRLLRATDGWVACNLARDDDRLAVDALAAGLRPEGTNPGGAHPDPVCADDDPDPVWVAAGRAAAASTAARFVELARLLGMPVAALPVAAAGWPGSDDRWSPDAGRPPDPGHLGADPSVGPAGGPGWTTEPRWSPVAPRGLQGLRVVDLSALWAGPLAAAVLAAAGATVTKVESTGRPDGARAQPAFYRWLHPAGQPEEVVDFGSRAGRAHLRRILAEADVVIESSRPRALAQLGAGPDQLPDRPGRVWLSITGHGRADPGGRWVGFGDDAAAAGGLVAWDGPDRPVFVGDAVADPLSGLCGALAVLQALARGGGSLVAVSMAGCAAALPTPSGTGPGGGPRRVAPAGRPAQPGGPTVRPDGGGGWVVVVDGREVPVRPPAVPHGFVATCRR